MRGRTALVLALALGGCAKNGEIIEAFTPPPAPDVAYVSPDGGDAADGTEDAPFASLRRALQTNRARIVLLPGTYPEPEIIVARAVRIEGTSEGRAVLDGNVFVSASDVRWSRIDVTGGFGVHLAQDVWVESASVAFGQQEDALSVVRSQVTLRDLYLTCGKETCLQATSATVTAERVRAVGTDVNKRGIRFERSTATLRDIEVQGGAITQLQASLQSDVEIRTATLAGSRGNALAVLQESQLRGEGVRVVDAARTSFLAQRAAIHLADSAFGATPHQTIAIAGGVVQLVRATIDGSADSAVSLTRNSGQIPQVLLTDCLVRLGAGDGVQVAGGALTVRDSRLVGPAERRGEGSAIVVVGQVSTATVTGTRIERPAGFGVLFTSDATGTVSATIASPGLGGVLVEDVAIEGVRLDDLVVRDCVAGSGVSAQASFDVRVRGGEVRGCGEAGYLAGRGARLFLSGVLAQDNAQYGLAAFGRSTVEVDSSTASGGRWAAFAACGDGSRIVAGADVVLRGETVLCP